jgi:hypothetical protein
MFTKEELAGMTEEQMAKAVKLNARRTAQNKRRAAFDKGKKQIQQIVEASGDTAALAEWESLFGGS